MGGADGAIGGGGGAGGMGETPTGGGGASGTEIKRPSECGKNSLPVACIKQPFMK